MKKENYDFFFSDTLNGPGVVNTYSWVIILYQSNNDWYATKLVSGFTGLNRKIKIFKSNSVRIPGNDSIKKLNLSLTNVVNEEFAPYIFKYEKNDSPVYDVLGSSHPPIYHLTFRFADKEFIKTIHQYDLQEKLSYFPEYPVNINFDYNKSLSLYTVYWLLKNLSFSLRPSLKY